MPRDISITTVRYFIRVAEMKSISKAAATLYVSQPTLSRQISSLEDNLHVALFTKTNKGIALTREGEAFYEKASVFLEAYDKFIEGTSNLEGLMSGSLSIAYQKSSEEFLGNCNKLFFHEYPNISVNCIRQGKKNIVSALMDGEYDIIYVNSLDVEGVAGVKSISLFEQDEWLLVPRSNPLAGKNEVSFEELQGMRFVMTSHKTARLKSDLQIAACRKHNIVPDIVKYADNLDEFIMDILTYDAICFMPFMKGVENDYVRYVRLKGHAAQISTSIAWVHETEAVIKYIEIVKELARDMRTE